MKRSAAALLALLAVLALGVAAAGLDATAGDGSGGSGGPVLGPGAGESFDLGAPAPLPEEDTPPVPEWVYDALVVLLGVLLVVGFVAFYKEYGARGFLALFGAGVLLGLLLWLLWAGLSSGVPELNGTGGLLGSGEPSVPGGAPAGETDGEQSTVDAPSALLGLFALVVVGAAVLVVRASGDEGFETTTASPERNDDPGVAAVGQAAGRAADRLEEADAADAENEVFRAWREMTASLDIDRPESTTPAEFADAAVEAGMDPGDVGVLTDLFEDVRYGDFEPTAAREEQAVAALRRIERAHTEADRTDADTTDGGSA